MIALLAYIFALFLIGVGSAVITYHIIRYRDPGDISGAVLVIYYILVSVVVVGTAFLVDWSAIFG